MKIRIVTVALALFVGLVAVIQAQPENLLGALAVSDTTVRDTSKDTIASPDTIQYDSDSLEYGADDRSLLLLGNAHLKYRTTILAADSIHFDQATQILEASGSPDVQDPTFQPFKGRALKYNLKTRFGAVYQARSFKNGEYFRGAEIRRFPDKTVQILDGDYCKCNGVDVPDYYFATERMEIEPDKVATAAPVVLNIEEVPVLIAPFVLFPLGKGRRSGFLTPKLGGDQKQGFFVRNLGMYWGISDYLDLTTTGDIVEGSVGKFDNIIGGANLRYAKRYWLDGNVEAKRYLQQLGGVGSGWDARYTHDQQLLPEPGKFTLKGQGAFVSNSKVRTDNALSAEELLDQTANADLTATYRWSGGSSVNLTASQQENLRTGVKTRELPGVSFQSMGQIFPADDPDDTAWYRDLRYSYNARFSSYNDKMADSIFKYQDSLYNARLNDSAPLARSRPLELPYQGAGQTLALTATHKVGHVDFTATGNLRHDWTSYSYDAPSSAFTAGAWHPYSTQWQPDQILTWNAGMNARTRFYGMWMPYWGRFAGLRHTVNPAVGYTFTPHIDPRPYFVANPKLGQATGQKKASQVTLSLGQILDGKILSDSATDTAKAKSKKGTSYSLLSLTTTTNYDLNKDAHPWDDISTSFNTGLLQAIQLNGGLVHTLYNPYTGDSATEGVPMLKRWSVSFQKGVRVSGSLTDGLRLTQDSVEMKPWSLSMDYSYSITSDRVSKNVFRQTRTQTSNFSADLKPSRDWAASWKSSYNFEAGSFVAHSLNFKRTLGCWDMNFGWTPVGPARGWTFLIQIRDLADVKIQAQSSTLRKKTSSSTPSTSTTTPAP